MSGGGESRIDKDVVSAWSRSAIHCCRVLTDASRTDFRNASITISSTVMMPGQG